MDNHSYYADASSRLSTSIADNIAVLKDTFTQCDDIVFRYSQMSHPSVCLIYLSGIADEQTLFALEQSLFCCGLESNELLNVESAFSFIRRCFPFNTADHVGEIASITQKILSGQFILLMENIDYAIFIASAVRIGRIVSEPKTERTVRGPQEGFVENIQTNVNLIRRKLQTPALKVEYVTLGKQSHTQVCVMHMKGIASDEIVHEVHHRLSKIDMDAILDSHYIESMIADSPKSPFPTVFSTERPDRVCGALLDGKVAVITDGTPFALTVPALFVEFLHASEDYYDSSIVASIVRWVRFLGLFVTLILPAFFVAITTYHQDLLQTAFLIRIAANRDSLPYPVMVEGIFMLLTFELLREAGLRMPKNYGGVTVTILGLILISQLAVNAGLIGAEMTIVVAVSCLTSFILPNYAFHQIIRFCGIPILIASGIFGFMGIIIVLMAGLVHLISLRSFGVPYFFPVSPARKEGWKDVFMRAPWWAMKSRAPGLNISNFTRSSIEDTGGKRHEN